VKGLRRPAWSTIVRGVPRIAVVGSVNLDLVARVHRLPAPGESLAAGHLSRVPGGKGANQALAARRLGAEVNLVAAVGDDAAGDEALALLRDDGVGLDGLRRAVAVTAGAEGAVLRRAGKEVARAEPPPVDAVDGTAAGDAFTAALTVALLDGASDADALRRACAAGALAATKAGAQPSLPTAAELAAVL
jgi:sugar/nucleoside kinase (ribokinase family)